MEPPVKMVPGKLISQSRCDEPGKEAKSGTRSSLRMVQQSQQGKCTWEDVMQRSFTRSDMWKMSPLRLAFTIRSVYDLMLLSRDNLQKWGTVEDTKCGLFGGTETLHHLLSNCTYALANGQYTWRHNQVLREVCEAAKAAVSKANLRTIAKQRKIYFLCEGFAHLCRRRQVRFLQRQTTGPSQPI